MGEENLKRFCVYFFLGFLFTFFPFFLKTLSDDSLKIYFFSFYLGGGSSTSLSSSSSSFPSTPTTVTRSSTAKPPSRAGPRCCAASCATPTIRSSCSELWKNPAARRAASPRRSRRTARPSRRSSRSCCTCCTRPTSSRRRRCGRPFHASCLREWLIAAAGDSGLGGGRGVGAGAGDGGGGGVLRGECPYCSEPISVKT